MGGRRDPGRQEPGRGKAGGRAGDRRRCQREPRSCATRSSARQQFDIKRDPTRLFESAMGNMVADAMRAEVPGRRCGATPTRAVCGPNLLFAPPSAGRTAGRDHLGRDVRRAAVRQPHGDPDAHRRAVAEACSTASRRLRPGLRRGTGRFPQVSGLRSLHLQRHHPGRDRHVEDAGGDRRPADADRPGRHRSLRHQRLHVHRR